ncbi:MAG: glycosyltransferase family 2 protein [Chlorobiales bacterium]|nr:glycosyltransferase family 2 protein [Chlorobiales bacterium]
MLFAVIPCYNSSGTLPKLFKELSNYIPSERIICVDDGSTDGTELLLERSGVKMIHHANNKGKGIALANGYEMALALSASHVLTLDSDLQHTPAEIPKFSEASYLYDIVIGSRRKAFTAISSTMPLHRQFSNRITSATLTYLCGQPILDSQCGYRLISASCLKAVLPLCKEPGFMFETEFLLHATRQGFRVGFVEIETIYGTGSSHMRHVSETLNFIKLIAQHSLTTK